MSCCQWRSRIAGLRRSATSGTDTRKFLTSASRPLNTSASRTCNSAGKNCSARRRGCDGGGWQSLLGAMIVPAKSSKGHAHPLRQAFDLLDKCLGAFFHLRGVDLAPQSCVPGLQCSSKQVHIDCVQTMCTPVFCAPNVSLKVKSVFPAQPEALHEVSCMQPGCLACILRTSNCA